MCEGEPKSASDRYSVVRKKEGTFIGHLLEAIARVLLFVAENISCNSFCSLTRLRKIFNIENFMIYDGTCRHTVTALTVNFTQERVCVCVCERESVCVLLVVLLLV